MRISAPVSFGSLHVGPALYSFLRAHPRIELSLELNDRFVGAGEGFDAIIRHGPIVDSSLTVKRLAPSKRLLVAAPEYLKQKGTPRKLADLERHFGVIYSHRASDWRFKQSGRWVSVRPEQTLRVNNGVVMRDAAIAGLGVALLPSFLTYQALAAKTLMSIDIGADAESATVFVAHTSGRRVSAKVLAMIRHLRAAFGAPPYWDGAR